MASFTSNALQSFVDTYSQNEISNIPQEQSQCCCGNEDCAYLQSNQSALDGIERELQNSARLGQSAQQEVQKLAQLAARTESLERELSIFEHEQATWQASLSAKEQAEKTAMRRWHDAERTLTRMTEQLERIERESNEEKQRHAEVVSRMERRHAVEKQLVGAADRLKSNAATQGGNVVSHFVKDILQDNATLQMGIVELRDMLQNSNEEVEKLRDQLLLHQPAEILDERPAITDRSVSLNDELTRSKQELHVHHHYHAPNQAPQRSNSQRRKKKRYPASNSLLSATSSGRSTPRSSISLSHNPSSAAAILRETAVSIPNHTTGNRWSTLSSQPLSVYSASTPGSPTTTHRTSSLFDRVFSDAGTESTSPPTSDGEALASPYFFASR
ncbi:hypothetical protein MRB53_037435 [Persea americana]|nr:hypothetical protein MRB53_037435 [Persea americana]